MVPRPAELRGPARRPEIRSMRQAVVLIESATDPAKTTSGANSFSPFAVAGFPCRAFARRRIAMARPASARICSKTRPICRAHS